jgi:diaminohydroxyphosphoribosylaminopyrimidine deaminase/5-amino-6-(5-phosphoribosylamino)uracil reductase
LSAKVVSDGSAASTTIVVSNAAPKTRAAALAKRVNVIFAPTLKSKIIDHRSQIDLGWLLKKLGAENVTGLLVEGGGEANAAFLLGHLAQRVAFFYAPKIIGGRDARKAVAGDGAKRLSDAVQLREIEWKRVGVDLLLTALVARRQKK